MNIKIKNIKKCKQKGFALIDVMVAALVLALGIVAFVNLENVSIKRSQQINFRLQATQSAASLIEMLRSDRSMINWLINHTDGNEGNFVVQAQPAAGDAFEPKCINGGGGDSGTVSIGDPSSWCSASGTVISKDLLNAVLNNFSENFQSVAGKAVMCLRSPDATQIPTQVRIVVVWKNAVGDDFTASDAENDCPKEYDSDVPNLDNLDTTNSDIGYFEIYTRI